MAEGAGAAGAATVTAAATVVVVGPEGAGPGANLKEDTDGAVNAVAPKRPLGATDDGAVAALDTGMGAAEGWLNKPPPLLPPKANEPDADLISVDSAELLATVLAPKVKEGVASADADAVVLVEVDDVDAVAGPVDLAGWVRPKSVGSVADVT